MDTGHCHGSLLKGPWKTSKLADLDNMKLTFLDNQQNSSLPLVTFLLEDPGDPVKKVCSCYHIYMRHLADSLVKGFMLKTQGSPAKSALREGFRRRQSPYVQ